MKRVVSQSEVAHLWANQKQDEARNQQGNFYFNGRTIYSYGGHFPIATHYNGIVLFTIRTYSNTTSGHISEARRAASHLDVIYCAFPKDAAEKLHQSNINYWLHQIEEIKPSILKARKPEIYIGQIEQIVAQMQVYLSYFKLKLTKAEKAKIEIKNKAQYIAEATERQAKQAKKDEAKLKLGERVHSESKQMWKEFASYEALQARFTSEEKSAGEFYVSRMDQNLTYLRASDAMVETSKGMKMPLDVAKRYFNFYKRIVANGGCNGNCGYQMLGYDVRQANEAGLIVGCHNIPASEIQAIATQLKWS